MKDILTQKNLILPNWKKMMDEIKKEIKMKEKYKIEKKTRLHINLSTKGQCPRCSQLKEIICLHYYSKNQEQCLKPSTDRSWFHKKNLLRLVSISGWCLKEKQKANLTRKLVSEEQGTFKTCNQQQVAQATQHAKVQLDNLPCAPIRIHHLLNQRSHTAN